MASFSRRSLGLAMGGALSAPLLPRPAASATDLGKVTLRIGDQTGASRGRLQAAGLLDDVPYRIEWSVFAAAVNLHEALRADAVDIGSANDSPTVSAIAGGSRITVVTAWSNGAGCVLLVPKDSPVRSLSDLRGRTVSPTTRGSVGHFLLVGLLRQAGIPLEEVKLAFLAPADASAAFSNGSIDAWATWGVYQARARGALGARLLSSGEGVNSGITALSATRAAAADSAKLAAIADYAHRVDRSFDWARANRDAYLRWYAGFSRQPEEVAALLYEEETAYRRVPMDDAFVDRLRRTFETWKEAGLLSGAHDFNACVHRGLPSA